MGDEEPAPRSKASIPAPPKFDDAQGAPDDGKKSGDAMPPPPPRAGAPPPPKFAAPPPRPAADPARAAAAAAARAAQHVTPAQRERAAMEAAAAAIAARDSAGGAAPAAAPRPPPGPYEPPDWSGIPESIPYTLEIMKNGAIMSTIDLRAMCVEAGRGYLTLGRSPDVSDILLDHPTSSRLHAVLQFRGSDGAPFLYDPGSTHGSAVNKKRAPPGQFLPLRVGDQLRFGESSRTHVLCGPAELMGEEGPNREARRQAAALEAMRRRKAADAAAAEASMARAISGSGGGASWGMGDDADVDLDPDSLDDLDWKAYAASKGLSDKQQKIADKIRKREARIEHLQREAEKILAKARGGMEELTAGQAATLSKNEGDVARAEEKIEELEEQLLESIRDALGQKKRKAEGGSGGSGGGRKRRRAAAGSDEDDEDGGSDEDSFYDRTARGGKAAARRRRGAGTGPGGAAAQEVEDAASLYGKLEALKEEKGKKEAVLASEIAKNEALAAAPASTAAAAPAAAGDDSLDAFMQQVDASLENDRVAAARREVDEVQAAIARTERLLKIADPDGLYRPGTKAAEAAVQRAKKAMEVETRRKEAEARQKREAAAAREAEATALAAAAVPEEEEEEDEAPKAAMDPNLHRLGASVDQKGADSGGEAAAGGLQVRAPQQQQRQQQQDKNQAPRRRGPIGPSLPPPAAAETNQVSATEEKEKSRYEARRAWIEAALGSQQEEEEGSKNKKNDVDRSGEGAEGEDVAGWRPPEGQTGDGRTSLNDRLGY